MTAWGHILTATAIGMADFTPKARASYEADRTTERSAGNPTITGFPLSSGRVRSSTDTKKASMSTCMMQLRRSSRRPASVYWLFRSGPTAAILAAGTD